MSHLKYLDLVRRTEALQAGSDECAAAGTIDMAAVLAALRSSDAALEGKTYSYSTGNALASNWLLQCTPERTTCELLDAMKQQLSNLVTAFPAKEHFIDITHLGNNRMGDAFQADLIAALVTAVAGVTQPVTIRYLEGNRKGSSADPLYFAQMMLNATTGKTGLSHVKVYFANLDVPWVKNAIEKAPGSWNHAKIFAVDGATSIVGGMNYWDDYLPGHNHLYDVAINLDGEVAAASHSFADYLWSDGVAKSGPNSYYHSLTLGDNAFGDSLPPAFPASSYPPPAVTGSLPVLAVGNLGLWTASDQSSLLAEFMYSKDYELLHPTGTKTVVENANNVPLWYPFSNFDFSGARARQASVSARHLTLGQVQAGGHIRISQQKIADTDLLPAENYAIWPGDFLTDIVNALRKGAKVDILVSHYDYPPDSISGGYSDDLGAAGLISVITKMLGSAPTNLEVRQTQHDSSGSAVNNHAKVWIANDEAYFVGSDNIYPGYLQEYGFVIADQAATTQFITDYWDPIWTASAGPT